MSSDPLRKVRVFLSHAREDDERVKNLYQKLHDAGFDPWMGSKNILAGEVWRAAIKKAIAECDFFLVCLSAKAVNKTGLLQDEIKTALELWREHPENDIFVIPIRLESCEMPESLREFQRVDLFESDGWTKLINAIKVGKERRAEESPLLPGSSINNSGPGSTGKAATESGRVLRIFVAWPLDVEAERNRAEAVIKALEQKFLPQGCRLEMLDWRKSVAPGAGNPEDIILEATQPQTWDVFIGILWKRFGTPLPLLNPRTGKPFASGFEAEYQRAHDLWQEDGHPHIMLYRCTRSIPHNSDVGQLGQVQNFFQRIEKHYEVLYKEFDSADDFAARLENDLTVVVERLLHPGSETTPIAFPHSRLFEDIAEETDFSNREDELDEIKKLLARELDVSILVHAPSGMGKSRLMERLQKVVRPPASENAPLFHHFIELDCHRDEKIATSVEALLLTLHQKLPQPRVSSPTLAELIPALRFQAVTLKGQKKRLLIFWDRIELMSKDCQVFIRQTLLPELQNAVYEPLYYPVVIAFGRVQPREWRRRDTVRFRAIELSPFSKGVIKDILLRKTEELNREENLNLSFPDAAYNQWAESILKISHGHPRCIVNLVSWLYERHFSVRTDFDSQATFLSFVVPVIEREILSEDNLAPQEEIDKKSEAAKWLRQILPCLCLFRSYSLAELRILIECKMLEAHRIDELENLLRRTFLIDRASSNQASFKPHETIRQLLADAVYYQNPEVFRRVHQTAHTFYHNWIIGADQPAATNLLGDDPRDFEQVHYIVESLYHYRQARRGQTSPDDAAALLERYRNSIRNSTRYSRENLLDRLDELLLE